MFLVCFGGVPGMLDVFQGCSRGVRGVSSKYGSCKINNKINITLSLRGGKVDRFLSNLVI